MTIPEVDLTSHVLGADTCEDDDRIAVVDAASGRSYTFAALRGGVSSLAQWLTDRYDLSSLRWVMSAAASLSASVAEQLQEKLGVTVVQSYGLGEASPCTHGVPTSRCDIDRGSIGVLVPNVQARLIDPSTRADVEVGDAGELWCRGPNVMAGYLHDPEATAETKLAGLIEAGIIRPVIDRTFPFAVHRRGAGLRRPGSDQGQGRRLDAEAVTPQHHESEFHDRQHGSPIPGRGPQPQLLAGHAVQPSSQRVRPETEASLAQVVGELEANTELKVVVFDERGPRVLHGSSRPRSGPRVRGRIVEMVRPHEPSRPSALHHRGLHPRTRPRPRQRVRAGA